MKHIEYNGYTIFENGTINRNGKEIATGRIYVAGKWLNGIDLAKELFKETKQPVKANRIIKVVDSHKPRQHGRTGLKHTTETKAKISKAMIKPITINGLQFNSIKDAATYFKVTRQTIYLLNKKALTT